MQVQTDKNPSECIRVFQECIRKRPLRLKPFPFKCEAATLQGDRSSIIASFRIAEPYGRVRMECERIDGVTFVDFFIDGNIRGRITAQSMAKNIVSKLS